MSTPYSAPPPGSPGAPSDSRRKGRRYVLFGCGGCLGLVVLLFLIAGILGALGIGAANTASVTSPTPTATSTATPTSTPTPTATMPINIEGEELGGVAEGALVEGIDGEAPRKAPGADVKSMDALEALEVKGRAPKTGYDREKFGAAWADVDGNGCDTRNDILYRDLSGSVISDGCTVTSGTLDPDPYTDTVIDFVRGPATSADVQIDHVVALSDAWQKGAQQLDPETRALFANDPLNLLAVDGPTNQAKGDKDAASWLPPNKGFRCEYVSIQIAVKAKYELWVTQAEKDAMKRVLGACDGQTLPKDDGTVSGDADALDTTPVPVARERETKKDVEQPEAKQSPFANCSEAAAAGRYNITTGEPGYNADLDRDGDGVACENAAGAPAPAAPKPVAPEPVAPKPVAPVAPEPVAPQPAAPAPAAGAPYANCTEVYANGESHLTPAHPRWNPGLDGNDNDGIGCESP